MTSHPLKNYRELVAWQRAMDVVTEVYHVARLLPKSEQFGMAAQLRRAAVSIPANIAEGYGRRSRGDYVHHLWIANGSLKETETLLLIAHRTELLSPQQLAAAMRLADDVGSLLTALLRSLHLSPSRTHPTRHPTPDTLR